MPRQIKEKSTSKNRPSELRQDLVSLDWVAIATGRAKRPHAFATPKPQSSDPVETCPFEDLERFGNEPVLRYGSKKDWTLAVISNKYPAFTDGTKACPPALPLGPYHVMEGVGFHEVFVLRSHTKSLAELPVAQTAKLLHAYKERYLALSGQGCVNFISIFHNHGREAGATLTHPHSQLIALPIIPRSVSRSLAGSERYYLGEKKCIHCVMLEYERQEKKRIVYENAAVVVVAPYASHTAFELRIFPKAHEPHFEKTSPATEKAFADALKAALAKLFRGLKNPAYNYFIHTAPTQDHGYDHYHWHMEVIPKTQVWAGFEIGTGIQISSIAPEEAAKFLRRMS